LNNASADWQLSKGELKP